MNEDYLQELESEAIYLFREAVACSSNSALLYSVGKDSSVMLHLALKAFYPAKPPFPLVHVDTLWKFQEMIEFRDKRAQETGMELIVHSNPQGPAMNISPFEQGCRQHTDIMKTEALRQVLDQYRFDVVFGGARRDEEASRAKERMFSFRDANHHWDPKQQRPELWRLFNTHLYKNESLRVFPLSNWTELDVWRYIRQENISVVPLYFAKSRPVFDYEGMVIMADDDRVPELYQNQISMESVRFRTLGCYPLTGAVHSTATHLDEVIEEMESSRCSERSGRAIDKDQAGSMEKKKRQGYF